MHVSINRGSFVLYVDQQHYASITPELLVAVFDYHILHVHWNLFKQHVYVLGNVIFTNSKEPNKSNEYV